MSSREQAGPVGCDDRVVPVVPVPVVVVVIVVLVSVVIVEELEVVVADPQARHTRAAIRRRRCFLSVQLAAPQLMLELTASARSL